MKKCLVIIFGGDVDKYLNFFLLCTKTFLRYNKDYDIYVLTDKPDKIPNENNVFKIINCNDQIKEAQSLSYRYKINQIKFYIPTFDFFYKYKTVLYLDIDTIIYGNLDDIYNISFDNNEIIGVDDTLFVRGILSNYEVVRKLKRKGKKYPKTTYINSGVLLYNVEKFNIENEKERIKNIFKTYNELKLSKLYDQDLINLMYSIKCIKNYDFNCYYRKLCKQETKIRHICCTKEKKMKFILSKCDNNLDLDLTKYKYII